VRDEHPGKLYLTKRDVMTLISMDRNTFDRFYDERPDFPRAIQFGGGPKRQRFKKELVYAWLLLYELEARKAPSPEPPETPETASEPPPKPKK
jgi:predicted DNA-binding transcriptional regulator AlpA